MSSQHGLTLTSRRAFLQRSALGFGSAFVLPSLLASCTDHRTPISPAGPLIPAPLLGDDYDIDWNDAAKTTVTTAISMAFPEGGELISGLIDVFWPDNKPSPWDQVKAQTQALITKDFAGHIFDNAVSTLGTVGNPNTGTLPSGLAANVQTYLNYLKVDDQGNRAGTNTEILGQWQTTTSAFNLELTRTFQVQGYEPSLLVIFTQYANMYLALLRDVVVSGKDWGRTDADLAKDRANLTNFITGFMNYVNTWYNTANDNNWSNPGDVRKIEPFRSANTYTRQMTFLVLDYKDMWKYLDVSYYPNGKQGELLTREIYTDPMGTRNAGDPDPSIPAPPPTQRPTQLSVWSGKYFNSAQVTYPPNGGPDRVTQTKRMGHWDGFNRVYDIRPDNPIADVDVTFGDIPNTIQFTFVDGSQTAVLGSDKGSLFQSWGYDYEILSSMYINGVSNYYQSANFVIFGFQYWQSPQATLRAIGKLYVRSPKERSAADFAKSHPQLGISAGSITEDLKAARRAYWERMKKRGGK